MSATAYRRSPLPLNAQTPVGWIALCLIGLIFSPFVGFAIHGKVAASGLFFGLLVAAIPLSGLIAIAVSRWHAWRQLPAYIVEEWTTGRLIPAEGGPAVAAPVRFTQKKDWIEIESDGLTLSRHSLMTMRGVTQTMQKLWIAEQTKEMFISWSDISEWVVDTDSDGPDYYLLKLRQGGLISVRRLNLDTAAECALLDAVRSVGKLPLRLRCDVECK
jgi:hypothetical protein